MQSIILTTIASSLPLPLWGRPGWGLSFTIIASFLLGFLRLPWMAPASPYKDASGLAPRAYSLSLWVRAGMRQVSKGVLAPWSVAEGVPAADAVAVASHRSNSSASITLPLGGGRGGATAVSASGRKADTAFSGMASRARPGPKAHHALIQPYPVIHVTAVPGRDPLSTPG